MKLITAVCCVLLSSCTTAVQSILPDSMVGIWTTDGSVLRGEAVMKGEALYLDTDGVGAFTGGDGLVVIGIRLVVTSFQPSTNMLSFDLTDGGRVIESGVLLYDPATLEIHQPGMPLRRFKRQFNAISAPMRKSLGLEARHAGNAMTITSAPTVRPNPTLQRPATPPPK